MFSKFSKNSEITSFDELEKFTGVTIIKAEAFKNCTSLLSCKVPSSVITINAGAFMATSLKSFIAPLLTTINGFRDSGAFLNCSSLAFVEVPNVTSIGCQCFQNCTSLVRVDINSVKTIGYAAFKGCTSLSGDLNLQHLEGTLQEGTFQKTAITSFIAPLLTAIIGYRDEGCFQWCLSLSSVELSSIKNIGRDTFSGCNSLTMVYMGLVESIDYQVFAYCTALKTIILEATTPPTLDGAAFINTNSTFLIYVPDASVTAYREASGGSAYADRILPLSEYAE